MIAYTVTNGELYQILFVYTNLSKPSCPLNQQSLLVLPQVTKSYFAILSTKGLFCNSLTLLRIFAHQTAQTYRLATITPKKKSSVVI
jgi:hypothetical protein